MRCGEHRAFFIESVGNRGDRSRRNGHVFRERAARRIDAENVSCAAVQRKSATATIARAARKHGMHDHSRAACEWGGVARARHCVFDDAACRVTDDARLSHWGIIGLRALCVGAESARGFAFERRYQRMSHAHGDESVRV